MGKKNKGRKTGEEYPQKTGGRLQAAPCLLLNAENSYLA